MKTRIFLLTTVLLVLSSLPVRSAQTAATGQLGVAGYVEPYNVVCIILDCSFSMQMPSKEPGIEGRVLSEEALASIQHYVEREADQVRGRHHGEDQYYLVAADAASQIIWTGGREEFLELDREALASMLSIRRQFAKCTDLGMAFSEAAIALQNHPDATGRYLLVFSDLINEAPRNSYSDCHQMSGEPPEDLDWATLSDADLHFYFVSKDFRYRPDVKWRSALARRGLSAEFRDVAQTLTQPLSLQPPGPATYKPSQQEIEQARVRFMALKTWTKRAGFYGLVSVGLGFSGIAAYLAIARRRGRRGGSA